MNMSKVVVTINNNISEDKLKSLFLQGIDAVKIELSKEEKFCQKIKSKVDKLNNLLEKPVSLIASIERTGIYIENIYNKKYFYTKATKIRITFDGKKGDMTGFSINTNILDILKYNDIINTKNVKLIVKEKGLDYLLCEVLNSGIIKQNEKIVIPSNRNNNYIDENITKQILLANNLNIDYLIVSDINNEEDLQTVKDEFITKQNSHISFLSEIANKEALKNIDKILNRSDGLVLNREKLKLEIPYEEIPQIKNEIIEKTIEKEKLSLIYTNVLGPSEEEISDIADSGLKGIDALIIKNSAIKPIYNILSKYIADKVHNTNNTLTDKIVESALSILDRINCKAIVVPTVSGYTAIKMSISRPKVPIIALVQEKETIKLLSIYYGIIPIHIKELTSLDKIIEESKTIVKQSLKLKKNDSIIITGGYPFNIYKETNFIKIEEL